MRSRSTKAEVAARNADKILLTQYQAQLNDEIWMAEAKPNEIEKAARFVRNFDKREKRRRKTAEERLEGRAQPNEEAEMDLVYQLFRPEIFVYLFEDRAWTPDERAERRVKMLEFQATGQLKTAKARRWLQEQIEGPKYYGVRGIRDGE